MIHGRTRKQELVDVLFQLGLSISYDRVLDISTDTAISAAQQYKSEGVVCPFILRKNLFTTAAVDNLDHNPSSTTSHGAFHGTGISLFQNRETESDGIIRHMSEVQPDEHIHSKQIPPLPEAYTTLAHVTAKQDPTVPLTQITLSSDCELVSTAVEEEKKWQNNTRRLLREGVQSIHDPISWAAFHSNQEPSRDFEVTTGSLLPLFPEDSKSVAMIRHAMCVVKQAVHHMNPGQHSSGPVRRRSGRHFAGKAGRQQRRVKCHFNTLYNKRKAIGGCSVLCMIFASRLSPILSPFYGSEDFCPILDVIKINSLPWSPAASFAELSPYNIFQT
ncbi:hypothetical protein PoB_002497800 [Plakobranchus ocellatus]|uniref:Uncharacterized protein n=1 Tax=Plakobranchus ocellatus TaxID=259542 RepID=A0AAV3ZVL6_9GAST|nr:hypothetical protein PoB_002497800 [Plakobranchus ocellatus]